jgi:glutathione S-transferase
VCRAVAAPAAWLQSFRGKTDEKAEGLKHTLAAADQLEAAFEECSKGKPSSAATSLGTWTSC